MLLHDLHHISIPGDANEHLGLFFRVGKWPKFIIYKTKWSCMLGARS